ncbi:MAG: radical SAM protein [Candidatus Tectomicrobia bacterium]|uniref:Radical SAM protein n=1 Tax=Tectimicrobiota bacterium TaxID=2528274 RepID=A0A938B1S1_UNCTE|nr:radical SAM protein [Candidatus Tectomicrobia bacterium]
MTLLSIQPPSSYDHRKLAERTRSIRGLHVVLLKPSKYDDDGYVLRHWRGVLPSNTLACLYALTEDVKRRRALREDLDLTVELLDEAVHKVDVAQIIQRSRRPGWKTVVCLVGVQSNQYPRAVDLARAFREADMTVIIGGFHVSGTIALFHNPTPDIQEILDLGVTVVTGEVEAEWEHLLRNALLDELKPLYNFLEPTPDLTTPPIPMIHKKYLRRFAYQQFGTIDCGRGCPFSCSFCSIINVQGRKMRMRNPEAIAQAIQVNYQQAGIKFYFFTDDNFARNKFWREIFTAIIRLQETDGIHIEFIMQVDVLSYKIKDFVTMARQAGCTQVFIGMESINDDNLQAADKKQNDAADYRNLIDAWHAVDISTHVGFIIGFPFDTASSITRDIERLKHEIQVDQASFFMLTPIPGSMDHLHAVQNGVPIDADLNRYDSFHPTMDHPHMSRDQWFETYKQAWKAFYNFENMRNILQRATPRMYWNVFKNIVWYKSAAILEGNHPMMTGFFRLKGRTARRPGYPIESRWQYLSWRVPEVLGYLKAWVHFLLELEELWLQTRKRSEREQRLLEALASIRGGVLHNARVEELQLAYARARLEVPSRLRLLLSQCNIWSIGRMTSREELRQFWRQTKEQLRTGNLLNIKLHKMVQNVWRELKLHTGFAVSFAFNLLPGRSEKQVVVE